MATRHLYVVRHGAADPFGALTDVGERQSELLGERLAGLPVDVVWHSPLSRAVRSAEILGGHLPGVAVREARPAGTETHEVLVTHGYPVAWLVRHALDAPPVRWLGLSCGNTALTAIEYRDGLAPTMLLYNDMGHLPPELRWTGFGPGARP